MKAHYFSHKAGRILAAMFFVVGLTLVSSTVAQAQWWPNATGQRQRDRDYRRDRDRDYRRDRDDWRRRNRNRNDDDWRYGRNSGYGNISQAAVNQGFQDGIYTGSRDAQRGQSYNPQRSHFYRNGHGDNDYSRRQARNSYQYEQAYRQGFVRGYDQGFRQYGGYNRGGYRTNNRWPW